MARHGTSLTRPVGERASSRIGLLPLTRHSLSAAMRRVPLIGTTGQSHAAAFWHLRPGGQTGSRKQRSSSSACPCVVDRFLLVPFVIFFPLGVVGNSRRQPGQWQQSARRRRDSSSRRCSSSSSHHLRPAPNRGYPRDGALDPCILRIFKSGFCRNLAAHKLCIP